MQGSMCLEHGLHTAAAASLFLFRCCVLSVSASSCEQASRKVSVLQ